MIKAQWKAFGDSVRAASERELVKQAVAEPQGQGAGLVKLVALLNERAGMMQQLQKLRGHCTELERLIEAIDGKIERAGEGM